MKKLLAVCLLVLLTLTMFGCGDDAPDGYMSVSLDSDPFILYVPKSWNDNSSGGIAGAHVSTESRVLVNAYSIAADEETTLAQYVNLLQEEYQRGLKDYQSTGTPEETTLGAAAALKFGFTAKLGGIVTRVQTYIGKYQSFFVTLTYSAPEDLFENYKTGFDGVVENFVYRTPCVTAKAAKQVGDLLLASGDQFEFEFYVPLTWQVNADSTVPTATYAEGGKTICSAGLNSMLVSAEITDGESYFEAFRNKFSEGTLSEISFDTAKLGQYEAWGVTFEALVNGETYQCRQVILSTQNMLYIFTYTAEKTNYEAHLSDAEMMLNAFRFSK